MVKLAIGEIDACQPLDGEMYGSDGLITQLFAIGDGGGNEKTEYFVLSVKAAAIPARSVDMAAMVNQSAISDRDKAQVTHALSLRVSRTW